MRTVNFLLFCNQYVMLLHSGINFLSFNTVGIFETKHSDTKCQHFALILIVYKTVTIFFIFAADFSLTVYFLNNLPFFLQSKKIVRFCDLSLVMNHHMHH